MYSFFFLETRANYIFTHAGAEVSWRLLPAPPQFERRIKPDAASDSHGKQRGVLGDVILSEGVTKLCATVSHPIVSVSSCQGGARIQNPVAFFSLCFAPPHTHPHTPLLLLAHWLAAGPRGWWMRCSRSDVKVCCSDTRSLWGEVAGRRPVSPFIHRRSNSVGLHERQRHRPII